MELGGGSGELEGLRETWSRPSLCVSLPQPGIVINCDDTHFQDEVSQMYSSAESRASDKLIRLKNELEMIEETEEFWLKLAQGMADVTESQFSVVSKRILVDEEDTAIEMPPIGQTGSCLMAEVLYYNDGHAKEGSARQAKYHAYSCPCAYMKHDKVFIIPKRLNEFVVDNPNAEGIPFPCESYIGVPLFFDGKCFAHFAVLWTAEGQANRKLSWAFVEVLLHSLEDLILRRLLCYKAPRLPAAPLSGQVTRRVVPHQHVTSGQSLKPYARSLSHELRTPMQGIVGMLDLMYATVREAAEEHTDGRLRQIFDVLKENIETVQDSSRRAVEAADNVVHAYDMNMGVPDSFTLAEDLDDEPLEEKTSSAKLKRPGIVVTGNLPMSHRGTKRKRKTADFEENPSKLQAADDNQAGTPKRGLVLGPHFLSATNLGPNSSELSPSDPTTISMFQIVNPGSTLSSPGLGEYGVIPPGLRHTNIRDLFRYVINDALKIGGRPESAIARETENGEVIEVRERGSNGDIKVKLVEWSLERGVPDTIVSDERDLAKLISCVFLNAIKFTDKGRVTVKARLSSRGRYIIFSICDTGCGIPPEFLPNIFKPFSREDQSLTRQNEGLGLGLLVAKGLARKLGGDLACVRSETDGHKQGTDFDIRVPLSPADDGSGRIDTPYRSTSPASPSSMSWTKDRSVSEEPPLSGKSLPLPTVTSAPSADKFDAFAAKPISVHAITPRSSPTPPTHATHLNVSPSTHPRPLQRPPPNLPRTQKLAQRHPLSFLVVEDNKINRKLLVNMLRKLGYKAVHEAVDGADAVRKMTSLTMQEPDKTDDASTQSRGVDVILMDLWMPYMDGYEATERILKLTADASSSSSSIVPMAVDGGPSIKIPTILAVTADCTQDALERAAHVGIAGFMTKPYKMNDLERLIGEYCSREQSVAVPVPVA